jgi:L-fucose isomerase-like protein
VPILIQAYPDDFKQLSPALRRDAYCGKISVSNNLVQAGIKFTLTTKHVSHPTSKEFAADLHNFLGVCRVVNGLRGVRLGAVGARPGAFNTVRYSEKILERHGISVVTVDLSEFLGKAAKLDAKAAPSKKSWPKSPATRPRPACRPKNWCRWPSSASCWKSGWTPTTLTPPRSNAGTPCRPISAATPARS